MSKANNNPGRHLCNRCRWGYFDGWSCAKGSEAAFCRTPVGRCEAFNGVEDGLLHKEDLSQILRSLKGRMDVLASDVSKLHDDVREAWSHAGPGAWEDYLEDALDMLMSVEEEANALGDWFVSHIDKIRRLP